MHVYDLTVPQLIKTLRNIDKWLGRASAHADKEQLVPDTLLNARLAPDQFPFIRQVQTAADNAKFIPCRLTGKQPPPHPDTETSFLQLRARLATVSTFIETFKREDFENLDNNKVTLPWLKPGQWIKPEDYLIEFALPNFYFHVTTAYSILRHKGVQLGKQDFIGGIALQGS